MVKANSKVDSTKSAEGTVDGVTAKSAKSAKGERARAGLKAACLRVLERQGYHKMRIADVTQEAGVAQGLFYHYFKDLKSLTLEVLTDFASASNDPYAPMAFWHGGRYAASQGDVETAWLLFDIARALPASHALPPSIEATAMSEQLQTLAPGFFVTTASPAAQTVADEETVGSDEN